MDGSLAERRQRDISPGNVESPRASTGGKTERVVVAEGRAAQSGGQRGRKGMKLKVGAGGEMESGTRSRWRRGARVRVLLERRIEGRSATGRGRLGGEGDGEILSRRGYKNFIFRAITPRTTATVLETPLPP